MGPNALFQYLWARIFKNYCHISNQRPQSSQIAKFFEKTKMPKFGNKNVLLGYSWPKILKSYCDILNQGPQICQNLKFFEITETLKFGTKDW